MLDFLFEKDEKVTRKETLILLGVMLLGSLAIYGKFFFGSACYAYLDAGIDTLDQYVPFYLNLIQNLQDGTFGSWNFEFGLGASSESYQSWLWDPFNLILLPLTYVLGIQKISVALVITQIVKILLCGILFNRLLQFYCETPLARIFGASVYAFSGFLIIWGQHYWLGGVAVVLTALLLLVEYYLKCWTVSRFTGIALLCAIAVGWSVYCGFMILLGCALYALLRIIHRTSGQDALKRGFIEVLKLALPVACGCLLACFTLVPYALYLFGETSRVSSSNQPSLIERLVIFATDFGPTQWLPLILSKFVGADLAGTGIIYSLDQACATKFFAGMNYYEMMSLGFSAGSLILLLQLFGWARKNLSKKDKTLVAVAALLVAFYCLNSFLPALFNATVEPKYRSSFVLSVPVCIALAFAWEKCVQERSLSKPLLITGILITLAVVVWAGVFTVNRRALCAVMLLLVAAIAVLFVVIARKDSQRKLVVVALCLLIMASSVLDGVFAVNNRSTATTESFPEASMPNKSTDTETALAYLRATDSSYYRVEKLYSDWNLANDSLVEHYSGVSSYNSTNDGDVVEFFETLWPETHHSIYQLYADDPNQEVLNDLLGVKYVLSKEPVDMDSYSLYEQVESVYIYKSNKNAEILQVKSWQMSETDFKAIAITEDKKNVLTTAVIVEDSAMKSFNANLITSEPSLVTPAQLSQDGTLSMSVDSSGETVACLAIPYTSGWSVYLNGEKAETFRADIGFIGFYLPDGGCEIVAKYETPGTGLGNTLSIIGLFITTIVCLIGAVRSRRAH